MASPFEGESAAKPRAGEPRAGEPKAGESKAAPPDVLRARENGAEPSPTEPGSAGAGAPVRSGEELIEELRLKVRQTDRTPSQCVPLRRQLASALQSMARWEEALSILDDAARLAERHGLVAETAYITIEFGKIAMVRGDIDRALECSTRAIALAERVEEPLAVGFAENLRGYALYSRGRLDEAALAFESALKTFMRTGQVQSLSLAYNNLGLVYKARCQWKRALEYFQVAANLQGINGDPTERRKGLHNLGIVHFKLGQWAEAVAAFEESLAIGRGLGQPLAIIRSLLGLAQLRLETGRLAEARDLLEQSIELCTQDSYPRETALTHRSLGQLHLLSGDFDRARRCFETAWKRAVELAPEGDLAIELLLLRAELALRTNHPREAVSLAERSRAMAGKAGDRYEEARAFRVLAAAARNSGDADRAEGLLSEGIQILREIETPYPLAQALLDLGRLAVDRLTLRSDVDRVLLHLEEALRLFRGLGIERGRGEALLALARAHVRTAAFDRAAAFLAEATTIFRGMDMPEALQLVAEVQAEIEGRFVEESVSHLNEFRATTRIQEILDARVDTLTRIGRILEVIAGAVEADGAMLVSTTFAAGDEPVAFRRVAPAVARALSPRLANLEGRLEGRPQIILNSEACADPDLAELARRNSAITMILVPLQWNEDRHAVLYLDRTRTGRGVSFRQSHLNLCVVLASYLTDLLAENDRDIRVTENLRLKKQMEERIALADVVTQNAEMLKILRLVEKINRSNLTVLLQGETGTGKTLIARAVHLSSPRAQGPFVTVDCAALPDNLLESELFGYMKGSFTGAAIDKKGLFEEADGGTIFLDEIGRAGLTVQRRLLHLLDKGEVRPIGSNSYRKLDVRVICATSSKDLRHDVAQGAFIKDLYFRLNDISIVVPSLRDRVEDIPLLAEYFLETFLADVNGRAETAAGRQSGATSRQIPGISRPVMNRLLRYNWPGNVRELEKVIRRAAILCEDGEMLGLDHLPDELMAVGQAGGPGGERSTGAHGTNVWNEDAMSRPARRGSGEAPYAEGRRGGDVPAGSPGDLRGWDQADREAAAGDAVNLHSTVEDMERRMVLKALEECHWNKSRAAIVLGLSRKGLKNKIARYGLDRPATPVSTGRPAAKGGTSPAADPR